MKIEKKEQLVNTYIVNDCPVKRDAYIELAEKLGCSLMGWKDSDFVKSYVEDDDCEYLAIEESGNLFARANRADMKNPCGCDRNQIPADFKQLHLSDLIDLENSKVYTTSLGIIWKYTELCGGVFAKGSLICGAYKRRTNRVVNTFKRNSGPDNESGLTTITESQINALYAEKFGSVRTETPEEKEVLDVIDQAAKNQLIHGALAYSGRMEKEKLSDEKCRWPLTNLQCGCKSVSIVAEWDGSGLPPIGTECEFRDKNASSVFSGWSKCKILCYNENRGETQIVIRDDNGDVAIIYSSDGPEFRKQETETERVRRERIEAAYDLYKHAMDGGDIALFSTFKTLPQLSRIYLRIVDKTGYRKG